FAEAGLDTDALVDAVAGSLAYNYLGTPDNVSNDLFIHIPFGEVTGIRLNPTQRENSSAAVYDLQGRRVANNTTLKPGIYVKNGRKVIER
ncbi:MAG: hypothetical protein IJM81_06355, partial [Prevotella sp.]|nr:hypothetical protein [Prevotella sp.]